MSIKTIYQAGYYSGNEWHVAAWGNTLSEAKNKLKEKIKCLNYYERRDLSRYKYVEHKVED